MTLGALHSHKMCKCKKIADFFFSQFLHNFQFICYRKGKTLLRSILYLNNSERPEIVLVRCKNAVQKYWTILCPTSLNVKYVGEKTPIKTSGQLEALYKLSCHLPDLYLPRSCAVPGGSSTSPPRPTSSLIPRTCSWSWIRAWPCWAVASAGWFGRILASCTPSPLACTQP